MTEISPRFEVARYEPRFKEAVARLWGEAFGARDRRAYLEWKYERNPYLPDPILYLARDGDGRVVGVRGFLGTAWETPRGRVVIPCAEDFAVAEEHRNTGVAGAIMRFALSDLEQRGFDYVLNASGGQVTVLQSLAMGWKSVAAMEPVARLAWLGRMGGVGPDAGGRRRRISRGIYRRLRRNSFRRLDRSAGRRGNIVVESRARPGALAELVGRIPAARPIRHVRDAAFFDWRYSNPAREYRFLYYEQAGNVEGYMALALSRPFPFHIADWEGASSEIRRELLDFAVRRGRFDCLGAWTGSLSEESRTMLAQRGFRPAQNDLRARGMPCVLLRKLGAGEWVIGGVDGLDQANWDIRRIDSMTG